MRARTGHDVGFCKSSYRTDPRMGIIRFVHTSELSIFGNGLLASCQSQYEMTFPESYNPALWIALNSMFSYLASRQVNRDSPSFQDGRRHHSNTIMYAQHEQAWRLCYQSTEFGRVRYSGSNMTNRISRIFFRRRRLIASEQVEGGSVKVSS